MWQSIALWCVFGVCLLGAGFGLLAAAIPTLRPTLRRGGEVRWPAFVCLMASCIFLGFPLMIAGPWLARRNVTGTLWAYFGACVLAIVYSMWRERIGRSATPVGVIVPPPVEQQAA